VWVCVFVGFVTSGFVYTWVFLMRVFLCFCFVMCGCVYVWFFYYVCVCVDFVIFGCVKVRSS